MKLRIFIIVSIAVLAVGSCTKLDTKLHGNIPFVANTNTNVSALINGVYNDFNGLINNQDQIFSLEENTADECLVPTRGGDWDDNGVWRVLHNHTWPLIHTQFITVFNGLGQMESDALAALASHPTAAQFDEALFLRSVSQFYFLDLFGQVPYRLIAEYNSIKPAPIMQPAQAIDTLTASLNFIIGNNLLPSSNVPHKASIDAAKFLLMKLLLNKGAYLNRQAPTFDAGDMARVIALGTDLSTHYSLTPNFFDNFGPKNATTGKEAIWSWPNNGSASNNGINGQGINARWMMTLHYNSWNKNNVYGSAGWNGFSTVASFYNTFEGAGATAIDTTKDQRVGGRFYPGVTDQSGLRPGLLVFQQHDQTGAAEVDRHGNPLSFTPAVNLVETDANLLEVAGIRIVKYPPDYNAYNGGNQTNQLQIFRYADVVLMVAEAYLRTNDQTNALLWVNTLRAARGASVLASITLVNTGNTYDPTTLLAERGRELYWEGWRRMDLIRFGVYLIPWDLKTADNPKYLLFPIPSDQLIANPNLAQNPGYQGS